MTELVKHAGAGDLDAAQFDNLFRQARALAASGLFDDARQAEQAFAKMLVGRSLGLDAGASLRALHVIDGSVEASANLQATMLRAYRGPDGERYDYRVRALDDDRCTVEVLRRAPGGDWDPQGETTFTRADAERAKLHERTNWQRYPRNMLFARALSNAVAFFCPEVTFGARVYSPGEVRELEPRFDPVTQTLAEDNAPAAQVRDVPPDVADDIPDVDVVDDEPEPEPEPEQPRVPPADRVTAAYQAAGRPAELLTNALRGVGVDTSGGLFAAVQSVDDKQADRLVQTLEAGRLFA